MMEATHMKCPYRTYRNQGPVLLWCRKQVCRSPATVNLVVKPKTIPRAFAAGTRNKKNKLQASY